MRRRVNCGRNVGEVRAVQFVGAACAAVLEPLRRRAVEGHVNGRVEGVEKVQSARAVLQQVGGPGCGGLFSSPKTSSGPTLPFRSLSETGPFAWRRVRSRFLRSTLQGSARSEDATPRGPQEGWRSIALIRWPSVWTKCIGRVSVLWQCNGPYSARLVPATTRPQWGFDNMGAIEVAIERNEFHICGERPKVVVEKSCSARAKPRTWRGLRVGGVLARKQTPGVVI